MSVHVPVFCAAKEGHSVASPVLLGTAAARAHVSLDITTATGAAVPGQAHLGGVALALSVPTGAGGAAPQFSLSLRGLQFFKTQLVLFDLSVETLGGAAELHALEFRDQQLQVFDLGEIEGELSALLEHQCLERFDVIG